MSKKLLGNLDKGLLFVVSAPAGAGKSTLVEMLLKEFPGEIAESCSSTTRAPRPLEIPSKHYDFISIEEFEHRIDQGEFLEHVKVFGNYYGTRRAEIERLENEGKHVILVIDTQGAMQIKQQVNAVFVFISAPSPAEQRARLFRRKTESEEAIEERLEWAAHEMEMIPEYDYHIINDNLDLTYQILKSIIIAEEHKQCH